MAVTGKKLLIANLLADVTLTDAKRAEIAGCSVRTIGRVKQQLLQQLDEDGDVKSRYQAHIERRIPISRCVDKYVELLDCGHSPTELATQKRIDELRGLVTAKEAKKQEEELEHRPMMIFPAGCNPIFNVNLKPDDPRLDSQSGGSGTIEAEVVRFSDGEQ